MLLLTICYQKKYGFISLLLKFNLGSNFGELFLVFRTKNFKNGFTYFLISVANYVCYNNYFFATKKFGSFMYESNF